MEERIASNRYDGLKDNISMLIGHKMKKYKITGCSIALVEGMETVWSEGFGYADKENNVKATGDTRYLIGSISKVFTGTAVMQLVNSGKLDIDKPVKDYIPEFSVKTRFSNSPAITVRNLMTHHSGLPCDNFDKFYNKDPNDEINSFRNDIDYLKDHFVAYPPNYIWSYSNLGTALLGIIVERVSGMDFCKYIEEHVLRPLCMNDSSTINQSGIKETMAKSYNKNVFEEEYFLRDIPAGNIVSNARDMASFIKMVLGNGGSILAQSSLNEMISVQNKGIALDNGFKMGLNWFLDWPYFEDMGRVCWHDGSSVHYNSLLIILPDKNLGVTLLSNSTTALPVFLREIGEEILDQALKLNGCVRKTKDTLRNEQKSSGEMEDFEGNFASTMGIASIHRKKNKLRLKMKGMNFLLNPADDGWCNLKLELLGFVPISMKGINNLRIKVQKIDNERVFAIEQRVSKHEFRQIIGKQYIKKDIPEAWKTRVGKFKALDMENNIINTLNLSFSNGILSVKAEARKLGRVNLILEPVSDNEAVIAGLGRYAGDTVYAGNENGVVTLEVLGLKFVKLQK